MIILLAGHALQKCNLKLFQEFFCPAEKLFRFFTKEDESISKKKGILESLLSLFFKNREKIVPCHDYDQKLAKRFFQIRLHLHGREVTSTNRLEFHGSENSSKSVKMRVVVKNQNASKRKLQKKSEVNSDKDSIRKRKKTTQTDQELKKFACKLCNKSYTQSHSLNSHVRIVHEGRKAEKRYKCLSCSDAFTQSHSLKSHIQREHNGNDKKNGQSKKSLAKPSSSLNKSGAKKV